MASVAEEKKDGGMWVDPVLESSFTYTPCRWDEQGLFKRLNSRLNMSKWRRRKSNGSWPLNRPLNRSFCWPLNRPLNRRWPLNRPLNRQRPWTWRSPKDKVNWPWRWQETLSSSQGGPMRAMVALVCHGDGEKKSRPKIS